MHPSSREQQNSGPGTADATKESTVLDATGTPGSIVIVNTSKTVQLEATVGRTRMVASASQLRFSVHHLGVGVSRKCVV